MAAVQAADAGRRQPQGAAQQTGQGALRFGGGGGDSSGGSSGSSGDSGAAAGGGAARIPGGGEADWGSEMGGNSWAVTTGSLTTLVLLLFQYLWVKTRWLDVWR